ncbi:hypothetical protein AcW1_009420 [Taiwanofungus camphoratus]|nr:hypothetical protein AcW1_009420 [Antrodia cinnamomea]
MHHAKALHRHPRNLPNVNKLSAVTLWMERQPMRQFYVAPASGDLTHSVHDSFQMLPLVEVNDESKTLATGSPAMHLWLLCSADPISNIPAVLEKTTSCYVRM